MTWPAHQFHSGQLIQFDDEFPRPAGENNFYNILLGLGLTTNLKLCLDVGSALSYPGSGQSFLDLSGQSTDFFLGADGSATATDPTFNGSAGGLSSAEYFSFDGGDYFRSDSANPTWIENLHKDNAIFTLVAWVYLGAIGSAQALCGTRGNSPNNIGIRWQVSASNVLQLLVANGSGTDALSQNNSSGVFTLAATTWTMAAVSLNEATGAGGLLWYKSGTTDTDPSTYTSPSASNATNTVEIAAAGGAVAPLTNGSRMGGFFAWEGTALSSTDLDAIFNATRGRYGV